MFNYKMVTDIKNNFFTNNKFIAAESLPTEGDFVKGDLIVNIGENANDEAMWLCVESGNPGVWEVVGAGTGGNTSGGGSSKIVTLKSRVTINNARSEVNIGISGFNKATDTLMVFNNTRFTVEGIDYKINADSTKIVAMNGKWNEELANDFVFDFVVFKMMNVNGDVAGNIDLSGYATKEEVEHIQSNISSLQTNVASLQLNSQSKTDNGLATTDKTIVGAINEVENETNAIKQSLVDVLINKGISCNKNQSWEELFTLLVNNTGNNGNPGEDNDEPEQPQPVYDTYLLKDGTLVTNGEAYNTFGNMNAAEGVYLHGSYLQLSFSYDTEVISFNKYIEDFSKYTTIRVTMYSNSTSSTPYLYANQFKNAGVCGTFTNSSSPQEYNYAIKQLNNNSTKHTYTFDISSWTGVGYLGFTAANDMTSGTIYITDIEIL